MLALSHVYADVYHKSICSLYFPASQRLLHVQPLCLAMFLYGFQQFLLAASARLHACLCCRQLALLGQYQAHLYLGS